MIMLFIAVMRLRDDGKHWREQNSCKKNAQTRNPGKAEGLQHVPRTAWHALLLHTSWKQMHFVWCKRSRRTSTFLHFAPSPSHGRWSRGRRPYGRWFRSPSKFRRLFHFRPDASFPSCGAIVHPVSLCSLILHLHCDHENQSNNMRWNTHNLSLEPKDFLRSALRNTPHPCRPYLLQLWASLQYCLASPCSSSFFLLSSFSHHACPLLRASWKVLASEARPELHKKVCQRIFYLNSHATQILCCEPVEKFLQKKLFWSRQKRTWVESGISKWSFAKSFQELYPLAAAETFPVGIVPRKENFAQSKRLSKTSSVISYTLSDKSRRSFPRFGRASPDLKT